MTSMRERFLAILPALLVLAAAAAVVALAPAAFACGEEEDEAALLLRMEEGAGGHGAWLGVLLERAEGGARIAGILDGSPAETAGLEEGDRIESIDGVPVETVQDLVEAIGDREPGDRVTLGVRRGDGDRREVEVELGEAPHAFAFRWKGKGERLSDLSERLGKLWDLGGGARTFLGVQLLDPSDALREKLGGEPGAGVLVNAIEPDSPAEAAGLAPLDLIVSVDGERVASGRALRRLITRHDPGDEVEIGFIREGRRESVRITLGEREDPGEVLFFAPGESGAAGLDEETRRAVREALERAREALEKSGEALRKNGEALRLRMRRLPTPVQRAPRPADAPIGAREI